MMNSDEYQNIAGFYDRLFSPVMKRLREDIRTYIFYKGYNRVIDICCGTGEQLRLLDRPDMSLYGIDSSPYMLEQAVKKCSKRIELHLLNAEQETFAAGSLDCAIISFGLHEKHPTSHQNIFTNSRKLIRQGGAVIIADFSVVPSTLPGFILGRIIIPLVEKLAGKDHHSHYLTWMQRGALEGFLDRQHVVSDIISQPFGQSVLCCAVRIDDTVRSFRESFGLLDQTLLPTTQIKV